jgi:hypothetical protein
VAPTQAGALQLLLPVHVLFERYRDWPFTDLINFVATDGAPGSYPDISFWSFF